MPLYQIRVGERPRKDIGDLQSSIASVGLLHPVVHPGRELIAGMRRLVAARLFDWKQTPVTMVDIDSVARGESAASAVPSMGQHALSIRAD